MRRVFRTDDGAVSPVIATILLVAITVILAGVLYVMVSGILRPTGNTPRVMGIVKDKTADGTNWTLTVVSTPLGISTSEVRLTIIAPNGATNVSKAFSVLSYGTDGAAFLGSGSTVGIGDRLEISALRYGAYYQVQIADPTSVLYSATFI